MPIMQNTRKTFPVNLLIENRSSLVIGGGKAALKKIRNLLQSEAAVTVVSPFSKPEILELGASGRIRLIDREFLESDLNGHFLVYCATSDEGLNSSILELCREKKILCCPVDRNWLNGDFITPATLLKNELSISVSSGGKSCRRSRMIKRSISRHIDMIDSSDLHIIGIDHSYLSLVEREPFCMDKAKLDFAGRMISQVRGVHEFMLLSTCNRLEVLALASDLKDNLSLIKQILGLDSISDELCYVLKGPDAFSHTCTLMAGLLSQIPGEKHIVAQVKEAFRHADHSGWAGAVLKDWFGTALGVSKKIRQKTDRYLKPQEIEEIAMQYAVRNMESDVMIQKAMVIGTGFIGRGVAEQFLNKGIPIIWCYNKTIPRLPGINANEVELCSLVECYKKIELCDCLVVATSSPDYLLDKSHIGLFPCNKKMVLVDLSMPRNISPDFPELGGNLKIADLDDLKHWFRREIADMKSIMAVNFKIIEENRVSYERIADSIKNGNPKQQSGSHSIAESSGQAGRTVSPDLMGPDSPVQSRGQGQADGSEG